MHAVILAVAAGLAWGVGEVATRAVLHTKTIGPFTAILVRSIVGLIAIAAAWFVALHVLKLRSEPQDFHAAPTNVWLKLVLGSGVLAGGVAMICFYAALSVGEVSKIKPIAFSVAPATGVLLGWLLLGERMSPQKLVGVTLILAGVLVLTAAPSGASHAAQATGTDPR